MVSMDQGPDVGTLVRVLCGRSAEEKGSTMTTKAERQAAEHTRQMRHIAAAMPHADAYAVMTACEALAAVLIEIDRAFPDPMKRAMASDAQRLAQLFRDVNRARDHIPNGTAPTLTTGERDYLVSLVAGDMDPSEHQASLLTKLASSEHQTVR